MSKYVLTMCMYGEFMLVFHQDLQTVFVRFTYRAAMIELTFEEAQAVARSTRASPGKAKANEVLKACQENLQNKCGNYIDLAKEPMFHWQAYLANHPSARAMSRRRSLRRDRRPVEDLYDGAYEEATRGGGPVCPSIGIQARVSRPSSDQGR